MSWLLSMGFNTSNLYFFCSPSAFTHHDEYTHHQNTNSRRLRGRHMAQRTATDAMAQQGSRQVVAGAWTQGERDVADAMLRLGRYQRVDAGEGELRVTAASSQAHVERVALDIDGLLRFPVSGAGPHELLDMVTDRMRWRQFGPRRIPKDSDCAVYGWTRCPCNLCTLDRLAFPVAALCGDGGTSDSRPGKRRPRAGR